MKYRFLALLLIVVITLFTSCGTSKEPTNIEPSSDTEPQIIYYSAKSNSQVAIPQRYSFLSRETDASSEIFAQQELSKNELISYLDAYCAEFVAITPDNNMEVMLKITNSNFTANDLITQNPTTISSYAKGLQFASNAQSYDLIEHNGIMWVKLDYSHAVLDSSIPAHYVKYSTVANGWDISLWGASYVGTLTPQNKQELQLILESFTFKDTAQSLDHATDESIEASLSDNSTIVVAIEEDFAPFSWSENGEYFGLHVDMAKELAKRMDVEVKFVIASFEDLIIGVDSGTYDLAFGLEKTADRAELVHFTVPYYEKMRAIYHTEREESSFAEWCFYSQTLSNMIDDGTMDVLLSRYDLSYSSANDDPVLNTPNYSQKNESTYHETCLAVGCDNIPNNLNFYCSEHACSKSNCSYEKYYSSSFCMLHKCNSIGCDNGKKDLGSYCSEHTCAEENCSNQKESGHSSIFCSYHECDDVLCENRKKEYGSYCSVHECAEQWCTSPKTALSDYCYIHDD